MSTPSSCFSSILRITASRSLGNSSAGHLSTIFSRMSPTWRGPYISSCCVIRNDGCHRAQNRYIFCRKYDFSCIKRSDARKKPRCNYSLPSGRLFHPYVCCNKQLLFSSSESIADLEEKIVRCLFEYFPKLSDLVHIRPLFCFNVLSEHKKIPFRGCLLCFVSEFLIYFFHASTILHHLKIEVNRSLWITYNPYFALLATCSAKVLARRSAQS